MKKQATVKQELKEETREPSLPLDTDPDRDYTAKASRTIPSDITTTPRPPKQPLNTKKPIKQADSLVRTRKQKEQGGEPLACGAFINEEGGGEVRGRQ